MEKENVISFEKSLDELKNIVEKLENGEATLDESMQLFQRGTELIKNCNKILDNAERNVVKLTKGEDGYPIEEPFGENDE